MIMQQLKNTSQMTYQEQGLAGYILSNPRNIRTMNAKELAAAALTSPSTVTRFCKKLGYTGYPQFQLVFIEEYGQMDAGMNWEGFKSISVAEAMDHTLGLYEYVIKETIRLNSKYKLQRVMAILQRAEKIDFYGNDLNYLSLQKMCIQLRGMGILAHSYNALNQDYINSLSPKGCAGVMVSHSGNNPAMLNALMSCAGEAFPPSPSPAARSICLSLPVVKAYIYSLMRRRAILWPGSYHWITC